MICDFCKKNKACSDYLWDRPICGECLEKYYRTKQLNCNLKAKENPTMKISYNGSTGDLLKLERHDIAGYPFGSKCEYSLSVYDSEKRVTHSFTGVKLEEVKFLGGAVVFDK